MTNYHSFNSTGGLDCKLSLRYIISTRYFKIRLKVKSPPDMKSEFYDVINQHAKLGTELGFYHLFTENKHFDGRSITVKGRDHIFFSSCSYLGLDTNETLKRASIDAIERFGVNLSSSAGLLFRWGFMRNWRPCWPIGIRQACLCNTPSTTLGHIAAAYPC